MPPGFLVDTHARKEADYELIAQDLKARYAEYDAVTVEFTDTEELLDYYGTALIFNTVRGSTYMGFFFGPINDRGYYVRDGRIDFACGSETCRF